MGPTWKMKDERWINLFFLVLYVNNVLLATNDLGLLSEIKKFLSSIFEMEDMGKASYVIGVEISLDELQGLSSLPRKAYINQVLERFIMEKWTSSSFLIRRGEKFSLMQCQTWFGMKIDGRNSICICC